ncbi:hypothetical protein ACFLZB_01895 [Nanoarchaeota archaeon]
MKKTGIIILIVSILISVSVSAQQFHPASQVNPGTFATGNFSFNGSLGVGATDPGTYRLWIEALNIFPGGSGLRIKGGWGTSDYQFYSTDAAGNNPVVITRDGTLGIGTPTPGSSSKLVVSGQASITGNVLADNNVWGTCAWENGSWSGALGSCGNVDSIPQKICSTSGHFIAGIRVGVQGTPGNYNCRWETYCCPI